MMWDESDFCMPTFNPDLVSAAFPWTNSFLIQMSNSRRDPFKGPHMIVGSDYSGSHSGSQFRVYGFVLADADASPAWPSKCRDVRDCFLPERRRMSFKNLNDNHRRRALIPFLEAAESLEGEVVVVAVTKELSFLSSFGRALETWKTLHGVSGRWAPKAFEEMCRVAHFFSLFLQAWSSPQMHISWITDEDEIVANPERLEDAHQLAASFCGVYVPHRLGEFMMNTPAVLPLDRSFEDFLAIPDLAAGMVCEALDIYHHSRDAGGHNESEQRLLSQKSDIIADWFCHNRGSLKKVCVVIDKAGRNAFNVGKLQIE